jgi:hypothetical protein
MCDVTVDSTVPTPDSADAYYRGNIEFHLSDADSTATIETDVPGTMTVNEDGDVITWEVDQTQPMAPNTSYSATLHYCGGDATINFTTSDLGTSISDPQSLVGRTYALSFANARIVEPEGVGDVLKSYITQDILIGVQSVTSTNVEMIGGIGKDATDPPAQEYCDPTIDFPSADFTSQPYFNIGPQTTTLSVAGYSIEITDLVINGTFSSDGSYFGGGTLAGTIDTRPFVGLVDSSDDPDPNAICDLAGNFGAACVACPSDNEPYCLTLVADQLIAEEVDGLTLIEVGGNNCEGCDNPTETTDLSDTCPTTDTTSG